MWKFRFYLTRDKRGLTKFLKSVTWRDPSEVKQAVEVLLPLWTDIEVDDALELLGPGTVDNRVRNFAVKQLSKADDEVSNRTSPAYTDTDLFAVLVAGATSIFVAVTSGVEI